MKRPAPEAGAPLVAAPVSITRRALVLVFVALMLSMLLASLNNTLISSATPTIVGELHGVEHIGWVVTSFILSSTIMMPIYGKLSDLLGRKVLLVVAIVVFMLGSIMGALAWNIEFLIVARVVQGLGGGGLMILSQAVIADVVPARERGFYMGIMGGVFAFSSVAGPLLGGWLTDGPGWRWAFWVNVPLGILALVGTLRFLRLPRRHHRGARIDYAGMVLLALATTSIVLVSVWGGTTYAWTSPVILGLIAAAVVTVVAFVVVERRAGGDAVIPMGMFVRRNFILTTVASLSLGIAMFGALGYIPTYLQITTGLGAAVAGLLMVPMMGALLIAGVVVGRAVSVTGRYKWAPIVGVGITGVALVLLGTVTIETPVWLVCGYLGVLGLGLGIAMQMLTLIVQNEFPNAMVGTATAANNYFRQVGATLGSAVVGAVFASQLSTLLARSLPAGSGPADGASSLTPSAVWALPEPVRDIVVHAFNDALMPVFLWIVPVIAVGFIATFFIVEKPLATAIEREIPAEALATGQLRVVTPELDDRPSPGPTIIEPSPGARRAHATGSRPPHGRRQASERPGAVH